MATTIEFLRQQFAEAAARYPGVLAVKFEEPGEPLSVGLSGALPEARGLLNQLCGEAILLLRQRGVDIGDDGASPAGNFLEWAFRNSAWAPSHGEWVNDDQPSGETFTTFDGANVFDVCSIALGKVLAASKNGEGTTNGIPKNGQKTDTSRTLAKKILPPKLPRNNDTSDLYRKLLEQRGKGKTDKKIARQFLTNASDAEVENHLRTIRRYEQKLAEYNAHQ